MIRPSITVSLVPEARGGPFVFWGDLPATCQGAAALGFQAVEVFAPSGAALAKQGLRDLLSAHQIALAAVGTGAGWVLHRLHLAHPDSAVRGQAREFIAEMIEVAAPHGAPAIVGSMQGRTQEGVSRDQALQWLAEALDELGEKARARQVPLLFEPLNRYETNLVNSMAEGVALLSSIPCKNVRLLADLFHMNIEETSITDALRLASAQIGHLHFVDSNRRPPGFGHLDLELIAQVLAEIGYRGYASAEALPYPTSEEAARQTMAAFQRYFGPGDRT